MRYGALVVTLWTCYGALYYRIIIIIQRHVANSTKCNCIFTVLVRHFSHNVRTVHVRYSGRERTVTPWL